MTATNMDLREPPEKTADTDLLREMIRPPLPAPLSGHQAAVAQGNPLIGLSDFAGPPQSTTASPVIRLSSLHSFDKEFLLCRAPMW